jgi:hypothetical protein
MVWLPSRNVEAGNNVPSATSTMSDADKPKIEGLAGLLALWNSYREVCRVKGFDVAQSYTDWAAEQKQRLASPGAREDFAELCDAGCLQLTLAAIVVLLRYSPLLEGFWTEMVGRPDNREKATRTLQDAAQTLEGLFSSVIALEHKGQSAEFTKIGRLPVSQVTSELRFYIEFINFAATLRVEKEIRSPIELSKYLLTSYIRKMTGRFRDRNASVLIQELIGPTSYDEVAQRMWRARNYQRIDNNCSWMTRFLVEMSVVVAQTP